MSRRKNKKRTNKKPNRQYKDTLFRLIFEQKEYALALYNAINHTDYTDVENLRVITLRDAMYINVKDDVGYVFHDIMNIFEQQASYNPNMPLRGLGYISDSLKEYISEVYGDQSALFSGSLIHIPTPRFYVLYNGTRDQPAEKLLKLSDAYDGGGDIELTAHMLNINKGYNEQLLKTCKPLGEYSELVDRVRRNKAGNNTAEDAVDAAIESCISDGILAEILRKERARVKNILIAGLNEEQQKKAIEWGKKFAIEEAVKKTTEEVRLTERAEMIDKLVNSKMLDLQEACNFAELPLSEYLAYKER